MSGHYIWTSALGWEDPDEYFIRMGVQLPEGWNTNAIFDMSEDGMTFAVRGNTASSGAYVLVTVPTPATALMLLAFFSVATRRRIPVCASA